jgi:hypothetical protein
VIEKILDIRTETYIPLQVRGVGYSPKFRDVKSYVLGPARQALPWTSINCPTSFKGLRRDKPASELVAELPSPVESGKDVPDEKLADKVKRSSSNKANSRPASAQPVGGSTSRNGVAVIMGITLSKPEKAFWPDVGGGKAVTKLDLARYYEAVGGWLLPHASVPSPPSIKPQTVIDRGSCSLSSSTRHQAPRSSHHQAAI